MYAVSVAGVHVAVYVSFPVTVASTLGSHPANSYPSLSGVPLNAGVSAP